LPSLLLCLTLRKQEVMSNSVALHAMVHGHVQGVFYRAFVMEKALELGLTGYARNLPSRRDVEVRVEGDKEKIEQLLECLKTGPARASVEKVTATWQNYKGEFTSFTIR
jgi:acylphosphatase